MISVFARLAMSGALFAVAELAVPVVASMPVPVMSVADFLGKVDALKAKGPLALFSPDVGRLKREGESAMRSWSAQASPPNACRPPGKLDLRDDEFLGFLRAIPPSQRSTTSVRQAVTAAMNKRYPCP